MSSTALPLKWTPPQSPIAYDSCPDSSPEIRVVNATQRILETRGPMTADNMTAALVIAGYGPLIDAMYAKPTKQRAPRRKSTHRQEGFCFA